MNRLKNMQAQNLIEYAIVVSLVTASLVAMSTYVFRSVQSTQKALELDFSSQSQ
jgi:Na+-transporting NADH:ubiquinone oxidoreductase subunit NqrC